MPPGSKIDPITIERYYQLAINTPKREFVDTFIESEKVYLAEKPDPGPMERNIIEGYFDEILRDSGRLWHEKLIEYAIKQGGGISPKVLKEYPDLKLKPTKPLVTKEPWQMTREEWVDRHIKSPGMHMEHIRQALAKGKPIPAKVLKDYPDLIPLPKEPWQMTREEWVDRHKKSPGMHMEYIRQALAKGKPVPAKVLKDYPSPLPPKGSREVVKKKMHKPRALPKEAENVQTIPFNSKEYTCYGKPIGKRSYRVYCRKKGFYP